jgi:hypothetical protein
VLTIGCLPKGTCCRHYHALVSTTTMVLAGVETTEVVVATLASRVPTLAGKGPLLLVVTLLGLLFLAQSVVA